MLNRLKHFIAFAALATLGAAWAATAGFVLKTSPVPTHVMPTWLWNLAFTCMMLTGLLLFIYCTFRCCDELFLKQTDTRRITGARTYRVTRRPA
jgi:hypothetical protein